MGRQRLWCCWRGRLALSVKLRRGDLDFGIWLCAETECHGGHSSQRRIGRLPGQAGDSPSTPKDQIKISGGATRYKDK